MRSFAAFAAVLITAAAGTSVPAAVTVIGSSAARLCYEAARDPQRPGDGMSQCNAAFARETLTSADEVATHVNRGIIRAASGDLTGAVADYDAALAIDPRQPEAWLNKGFAVLRTGNAAGALPYFDAAVANRSRELALAHYGRGVAYEQTGNLRAAYSDYVRARDLRPQWDAPQKELVRFKVAKRATP